MKKIIIPLALMFSESITHQGYVGLCMAVYGYVLPCRAVYGYVGLCMALYGLKGLCYGYVSQ